MTTLYISEFSGKGWDANGHAVEAAKLPELVTQIVAVGGATAQSVAFTVNTGMVRLISDVTCSIAVGANPTATTSSMRLYANQPEYFTVTPGHKLAVIANT